MSVWVWLAAACFVALGVLAYAGIWRGWMRVARGFGTYIGFSLLFIGLALVLAAIAVSVAGASRGAFFALLGVAALPMIVAIVGFWWMPEFLQPRWFRQTRASAPPRESRR
jgi:hypothetical protein